MEKFTMIVDAIRKAKHGTVAQIAEIAGITPKEAIEALQALQKRHIVAHRNCLWYVVEDAGKIGNRQKTLIEIISEFGPQDVRTLRRMTNRTAHSLTSELMGYCTDRLMVREDGLYRITPKPERRI